VQREHDRLGPGRGARAAAAPAREQQDERGEDDGGTATRHAGGQPRAPARSHNSLTNCWNYQRAMRVLIVEDEPKMAALIRRGLRAEGVNADVVGRGEEAVVQGGASPYDAIVLDVMLPGMDGFAACRALREQGTWTPVLMLTARDAVEDRVR